MKLAGHKTVAMAEHYANHNDQDDLREAAQHLPTLLPAASSDVYPTVRRNRLANLAYTLPPETIDYILSLAIPAKSS